LRSEISLPEPDRVDTSEPAAARAYRALERMIVMLQLAPGEVTTEGALIDMLSLGRTPVREAIQRLAWEGLISVRPRAGLEIAPLHAADWVKVIDARRGCEAVLARSAARFATAMTTDRLRAAADEMQAAVAQADVACFLQADKTVDEAIALCADNPFAVRLVAPLQTHSRRFWFRFQSAGLAQAAAQHISLISAIVERDEEAAVTEAERLMVLLREQAVAAALR
jgi:DNA-binding GntR family transcriptional regulator